MPAERKMNATPGRPRLGCSAVAAPGWLCMRTVSSRSSGSASGTVARCSPKCVTNPASGPNARRRTVECNPSAPTTRSNRAGAARSKVTSTPCPSPRSPVMPSPNRMSASCRAASTRTPHRSARAISSSRCPLRRVGMLPTGRPEVSTSSSRRTAVASPDRRGASPRPSTTSNAAPRTSTGLPLDRTPWSRSTTVTSYPERPSRQATVAPAMPAPDTSTRRPGTSGNLLPAARRRPPVSLPRSPR